MTPVVLMLMVMTMVLAPAFGPVFAPAFAPARAYADGDDGHVSLFKGELASLFSSHAKSGRPEDADVNTSKIWKLWTNDARNIELMRRGMTYMEIGNLSIAEEVFTRILEREPTFMEAWNKRATVRYMMSDLKGSEDDIKEVLKREPRHFGALSGLGMIKLQNGQLDDALDIYTDILVIHPFSPDAVRLIPELQNKLRGDPA
ncbi:MAG: tetratricopeptide repeat protein [Alphaproteobacteria bacterium]|nr:tetratricopeptide repeat protein [Alphaproteobacteria bacterium]